MREKNTVGSLPVMLYEAGSCRLSAQACWTSQGSLFLDFGVTLSALPLIHLGGIRVGVQPHESEKASVSARLQTYPGIQSLNHAS